MMSAREPRLLLVKYGSESVFVERAKALDGALYAALQAYNLPQSKQAALMFELGGEKARLSPSAYKSLLQSAQAVSKVELLYPGRSSTTATAGPHGSLAGPVNLGQGGSRQATEDAKPTRKVNVRFSHF